MMAILPLRLLAVDCKALTNGNSCNSGLPPTNASSGNLHEVLSIAIGTIAAVSMLMIVVAGLRFIGGQGNPQEMAKARGTIVYALVGLLIAIASESFLRYIFNSL